MRTGAPRYVVEDMLWDEICKLSPKSNDLFWLPVNDIVVTFWFAWLTLACNQLYTLMQTLEVWVASEGNIIWRNKIQGTKLALSDALLGLTGKEIDRIVDFDEKNFEVYCAQQDVHRASCHVLIPMHVPNNLISSLDQSEVINWLDWHIYFTRDYLITYWAHRINKIMRDTDKFAKLKQRAVWTEN